MSTTNLTVDVHDVPSTFTSTLIETTCLSFTVFAHALFVVGQPRAPTKGPLATSADRQSPQRVRSVPHWGSSNDLVHPIVLWVVTKLSKVNTTTTAGALMRDATKCRFCWTAATQRLSSADINPCEHWADLKIYPRRYSFFSKVTQLKDEWWCEL